MEERQNKNENAAPEEGQDSYSFMKEILKDETGHGRRIWKKILKSAGFGLVFGLATCAGFVMLKPWAEQTFLGNQNHITIPEEETEIRELHNEEEIPITAENYREMNKILNDIAKRAENSIVSIGQSDVSLLEDTQAYDEVETCAGVIVADNGSEILVLVNSDVYKGQATYSATFCDGRKYDAALKKKDENIGIAVFSIDKSKLSKTTMDSVRVAKLGSSLSLEKGDPIIVCGNPFGYEDATGFGVIASPANKVVRADGEYQLICTDVTSTEGGTGVLVNIDGDVVGLINENVSDNDCKSHVTAYGISDLKSAIELLSNGQPVPYLGIVGVTVTEELAEEYGMPIGIYVQSVKPDSPAMKAGIQTGDILTKVGKETTNSLAQYHVLLMKEKVGNMVKVSGHRQSSEEYVEIEFSVETGSWE